MLWAVFIFPSHHSTETWSWVVWITEPRYYICGWFCCFQKELVFLVTKWTIVWIQLPASTHRHAELFWIWAYKIIFVSKIYIYTNISAATFFEYLFCQPDITLKFYRYVFSFSPNKSVVKEILLPHRRMEGKQGV